MALGCFRLASSQTPALFTRSAALDLLCCISDELRMTRYYLDNYLDNYLDRYNLMDGWTRRQCQPTLLAQGLLAQKASTSQIPSEIVTSWCLADLAVQRFKANKASDWLTLLQFGD